MSDKSAISLLIINFLVVFSLTTIAHAETIVLKSGERVEGKVLERTDEYIKLELDGMPRTFWIDGIESIDGKSLSENNVANQPPAGYLIIEPYGNKAAKNFIDKKYEDSLSLIKKALLLEPNNFDLNSAAGVIYYYLNNFEESLVYFKKALNSKPDNGDVYLCLGIIYDSLERPEDAKESLLKAGEFYQREADKLDSAKIIAVKYLLKKIDTKK
jgi:tetratricopeptide (TPR) repeat protein